MGARFLIDAFTHGAVIGTAIVLGLCAVVALALFLDSAESWFKESELWRKP